MNEIYVRHFVWASSLIYDLHLSAMLCIIYNLYDSVFMELHCIYSDEYGLFIDLDIPCYIFMELHCI